MPRGLSRLASSWWLNLVRRCATIWLNINSELHQSGTQIDAIMKTEDRELFSKVRKKKAECKGVLLDDFGWLEQFLKVFSN